MPAVADENVVALVPGVGLTPFRDTSCVAPWYRLTPTAFVVVGSVGVTPSVIVPTVPFPGYWNV